MYVSLIPVMRPLCLFSTSFRWSRISKNRSRPVTSTEFNPYRKPRQTAEINPIEREEMMRDGRLGCCCGGGGGCLLV